MATSLYTRCFILWIIGFGVICSIVVSEPELHHEYAAMNRLQVQRYQPLPFKRRRYYHYPVLKSRSEFVNVPSKDLYHDNYYGRPRFFHLKFDHMWNFSLDIG